MQIIRFLFTKMWNVKWLTFSSLLGLVIAVSLTTSIPMYTNGALKNLIYKELETNTTGLPAGALTIRYQTIGNQYPDDEATQAIQQYITNDIAKAAGFPVEYYVPVLSLKTQNVKPAKGQEVDGSKRRQLGVVSMAGIEEHITITDGKLFSDTMNKDIVEAIVPKESPYIYNYPLGTVFDFPIQGSKTIKSIKVKIVGSFEPQDETSKFWFQGKDALKNMMVISDHVMTEDLLGKGAPLNIGNWFYAFDLRNIQSSQMNASKRWLENLDIQLNKILPNTKVEISFLELLQQFSVQNNQLSLLLFTLAAPILVLVFYFIAMNARQSLERQRGDIAVLRSRGGSASQIFWLYLIEGVLLGVVALFIGPLLGYLMAKSLGSSSGFLHFVNRKAVYVDITMDVWLYAALAVVLAIIASVIPALSYARQSIVSHKQDLARATKAPLWQRMFLDVALFGLAGYGWYLFQQRKVNLVSSGLTSDQLQVEPLLFFVPAIFLFASGLLFIRLFPWMLRLLFIVTRQFRSIPIYLTMTQLSRSAKQYHPVMLLLTLTLGLGVYSASTARTIDLNTTESGLYQYGTDVVMQAQWSSKVDLEAIRKEYEKNPGQVPDTSKLPTHYVEPPFEVFRNLHDADGAARVFNQKVSISVGNKGLGQGNMMAIDNADFAKVAYFKRDLYPKKIHPFQYLNLLGQHEAAMLVSQKFLEKNDLEPGTIVTLVVKQRPIEFVLYAGVPYWPTLYPDEAPFFIVNLDYVFDQMPLEPYDVWIKKAEDGSVHEMMKELVEHDTYLVSVADYKSEMIREMKHPSKGGVFGVLSLGFLVSIFISLIGYILYWFFALSQRTVQFGILRASGLTRKELTTMLVLEQILTAGTSIIVGVLGGQLASRIFIPFMQASSSAQKQVPPFQVVFDTADLKNLLIVVMLMMGIGVALLVVRIRSLRVHQAVKLGEER